MLPCAGEHLLLVYRQHLLSGRTKTSTYRRSFLPFLDFGPAVLTIRQHHDHTCFVQRRVCDDRRGANSCSPGAIEDARIVRDLEPADDLTEGDTHPLERAPSSLMKGSN